MSWNELDERTALQTRPLNTATTTQRGSSGLALLSLPPRSLRLENRVSYAWYLSGAFVVGIALLLLVSLVQGQVAGRVEGPADIPTLSAHQEEHSQRDESPASEVATIKQPSAAVRALTSWRLVTQHPEPDVERQQLSQEVQQLRLRLAALEEQADSPQVGNAEVVD